jgi:hypothetical protein
MLKGIGLRGVRTAALLLMAASLLFATLAQRGRAVDAKERSVNGEAAAAPRRMTAAVRQANPHPSVAGSWELQENGTHVDNSWPLTPIHINLLPNGKLLFWGRDKSPDGEGHDIQFFTTARVWDPFYKSFAVADNHRTNLFCSGHTLLPDGRLLVAGGHELHPDPARRLVEGLGSKNINVYDYRTNQWTPGPDMNNGRWYPFNVTLGNGETLIVSGSFFRDLGNGNFSVPQNTVAQISDAAGNLRNVITVRDGGGNRREVDNYPLLHLMPDGRVLVAADETNLRSLFLTTSANSGGGQWAWAPVLNTLHETGTSVSYESGKVLIAGGRVGLEPTNVTEIFDVWSLPHAWRQTTFGMHFRRMHHTATLLPDGKVLVTGGTSCPGTNEIDCGPNGAVKTPELWNPQTETWTMMAPHQEARVYHSTAILLPDGRVLVGGGGLPGAAGEFPAGDERARRNFQHRSVEIFNPPYLFMSDGERAPRPAIASAPKEINYGQSFNVSVGNVRAQEVESAVLIRLGAVTHGFNQDQRRVPLSVTAAADGRTLNVAAPSSGNECPPGHYMLFLLKRNEQHLTPSVAKIVRVNKVAASSTQQVFGSAAETRQLAVGAPAAGPAWTATVESGASFITITSPSGPVTGNGQLGFSVAANTTGGPRTGKITIRPSGQPVFNQDIFIHQGRSFSDVPATGPADDGPGKLSAMGITGGCGGGMFCPDRLVTRGEVAVFFVSAALGPGGRPPATSRVTFSDVPDSNSLHDHIEDFAKRGYSSGCGGSRFCPTSNVTRGQLAVFLVRALELTLPAATTQTFEDVTTTHPLHRFVEEVAARSLMSGCAVGPNRFCPDAPVTRLEVANAIAKVHGF